MQTPKEQVKWGKDQVGGLYSQVQILSQHIEQKLSDRHERKEHQWEDTSKGKTM